MIEFLGDAPGRPRRCQGELAKLGEGKFRDFAPAGADQGIIPDESGHLTDLADHGFGEDTHDQGRLSGDAEADQNGAPDG